MAILDPRGRLRVARWRGTLDTALLAPRSDGRLPDAGDVARCLEGLADAGVTSVVTGALNPREQVPFLAAGFRLRERLHLLVHDLDELPPAPPASLRRPRRGDRDAALAVDARSFDGFWSLDDRGLQDAIDATASSRFRVASGPGGRVIGYAVTGRAAERGYLQRLAVDPAHRARGTGTALVLDGLAWLHRRRARSVVVNTQEDNESALRLYRRLGFRYRPDGLVVLGIELGAAPIGELRP